MVRTKAERHEEADVRQFLNLGERLKAMRPAKTDSGTPVARKIAMRAAPYPSAILERPGGFRLNNLSISDRVKTTRRCRFALSFMAHITVFSGSKNMMRCSSSAVSSDLFSPS